MQIFPGKIPSISLGVIMKKKQFLREHARLPHQKLALKLIISKKLTNVKLMGISKHLVVWLKNNFKLLD